MKKLPRIHGQLELPQNGNLAHVRTREDLLPILGFCPSDETSVVHDGPKGEILEDIEDDTTYRGSDNGDYTRQPSGLFDTNKMNTHVISRLGGVARHSRGTR